MMDNPGDGVEQGRKESHREKIVTLLQVKGCKQAFTKATPCGMHDKVGLTVLDQHLDTPAEEYQPDEEGRFPSNRDMMGDGLGLNDSHPRTAKQ